MRNSKVILPSILTGFIITSLNTSIEFFADNFDVYRVTIPLKIPLSELYVLSTPLPLYILWFLASSIYVLLYDLLVRKHGNIYILLGIVAGWLMDTLGWVGGFLVIGNRGHPVVNALVWVILVPLSLKIYRTSKRLADKIFS